MRRFCDCAKGDKAKTELFEFFVEEIRRLHRLHEIRLDVIVEGCKEAFWVFYQKTGHPRIKKNLSPQQVKQVAEWYVHNDKQFLQFLKDVSRYVWFENDGAKYIRECEQAKTDTANLQHQYDAFAAHMLSMLDNIEEKLKELGASVDGHVMDVDQKQVMHEVEAVGAIVDDHVMDVDPKQPMQVSQLNVTDMTKEEREELEDQHQETLADLYARITDLEEQNSELQKKIDQHSKSTMGRTNQKTTTGRTIQKTTRRHCEGKANDGTDCMQRINANNKLGLCTKCRAKKIAKPKGPAKGPAQVPGVIAYLAKYG